MCLDAIDRKPRFHRIGFKIFQLDKDVPHFFRPFVFMKNNLSYTYGLEYDSKPDSDNELKTERVHCHEIETWLPYKAGFHYLRSLDDAIYKVHRSDQAIVKIQVREILATGEQYGMSAGVSRFMTLIEQVYTYEEVKRKLEITIERKYIKECKKYGRIMLKFFDFIKKNEKVLQHGIHGNVYKIRKVSESFLKFLLKSKETYYYWIAMLDKTPRKSKVFRCGQSFHFAHYRVQPYSGLASELYLESCGACTYPPEKMHRNLPKCPEHIDRMVFG